MIRARPPQPSVALSGIDRLLADSDQLERLKGRRVGLLTNAACRTADGAQSTSALDAALASPSASPSNGGLACLFAPEHGFAADQQAGASVADHRDGTSGIQVVSLYGARQAPTPEHLDAIDTLIIDLRDVGVRCYTYAATAAKSAAAALDGGAEVIICDRENPLGAASDGPPLDTDFRSFLAYFDVPFIHGQTIGALLTGALQQHPRRDDMTVIATRSGGPGHTADWVPPSPSLTTPETIPLYPGLVLFEGTNLSEGRGTPLSFRCIGAPGLDATGAAEAANGWPTGIQSTACEIQSTTGDFAGQTLPAVRFEHTQEVCDGFGFGVRLLAWAAGAYADFRWRTAPLMTPDAGPGGAPERYAIDTLLGTDSLRLALERGDGADDILAMWRG